MAPFLEGMGVTLAETAEVVEGMVTVAEPALGPGMHRAQSLRTTACYRHATE